MVCAVNVEGSEGGAAKTGVAARMSGKAIRAHLLAKLRMDFSFADGSV
jgi:hypothetical protein